MPILPGFPGSVMAIVLLLTTAAKPSLVTVECRPREAMAGPAVNEVARIAAMCRSAERNVLLSQAFADAMTRLERGRLVSVGRYALRGVERPQELFTLDPFWTV